MYAAHVDTKSAALRLYRLGKHEVRRVREGTGGRSIQQAWLTTWSGDPCYRPADPPIPFILPS